MNKRTEENDFLLLATKLNFLKICTSYKSPFKWKNDFYGLFHLTGLLYKEQSYTNHLHKVIAKFFLKDIFY